MLKMSTTLTTRHETEMDCSPPLGLYSSSEQEVEEEMEEVMMTEGQKYSAIIGIQQPEGKGKKNYYYGQSPSHQAVIYRNVKYSGTWTRYSVYVNTYVKLWLTPLVTGPLLPWINQCREYLLQILGFFYFILFTPLHLFIGFVLLLIRQIRLYLVRKYYPNALVALDLDLAPRNVFSSGKNLEMVTTIIMLKGKLDVQKLRSYFSKKSLNSCILLRKKMTRLVGVRVFLESAKDFDISRHIVEAPSEFLKYFVMDEKIVGKSALQRFVTSVASENLNVGIPPWKITVIPHPVFNKEKTYCVIRFHYVLLNDPQVSQMLDNIFNQSVYHDDDHFQQQPSKVSLRFPPRITENSHQIKFLDHDQSMMIKLKKKLIFCNNNENSTEHDDHNQENENGGGRLSSDERRFEEPTIILFKCFMKMSYNFQHWIYSNLYVSRSDMKTWINHRKKQFEFHGRSAIVKSILYELFIFLKKLVTKVKSIPQSSHCTELIQELRHMMELLTIIVRAICFVPVEIISSILFFFHHDPTRGVSGLLRRGQQQRVADRRTEIRRISWSAPISRDLLKHIKSQTGASTQSILLAAIADSLKDYFSETGLRNPKSLGVMLPVIGNNLLESTGYRTLTLSTEQICVPEQLKKVDSQLKSFASWKILGNYYIMRYVTYILPRPLTNLLLQKIFKRYPISFTKLDLQPPSSYHLLPHMSLWGQTVEEFSGFWCPPQSDYSVSVVLVNYAEVLRISVQIGILSPMNSLDTALTQRFSQNLNRIAEQSGVDRHLIPYSRKSSPLSSTCPSPFVLRSDEK